MTSKRSDLFPSEMFVKLCNFLLNDVLAGVLNLNFLLFFNQFRIFQDIVVPQIVSNFKHISVNNVKQIHLRIFYIVFMCLLTLPPFCFTITSPLFLLRKLHICLFTSQLRDQTKGMHQRKKLDSNIQVCCCCVADLCCI